MCRLCSQFSVALVTERGVVPRARTAIDETRRLRPVSTNTGLAFIYALVRPEGDSPTARNASYKPNVFVLGKHAAIGGSPGVTNSEVDLIGAHKNGLLLLINGFCPPLLKQIVEEILW